MKRWSLILLHFSIILVLGGCTTLPILTKQIPALSVTEKIPLKVALLIPESSRDFIHGERLRSPCLYDLAPSPYGVLFEETVKDTVSQIFDDVSVVRTLPEAREFDAVLEAAMTGFAYKVSCFISEDEYYIAKGTFRLLGKDGKEMWRSGRTSHRSDFQLVSRFITPRVGGQRISLTIASLVEAWAHELRGLPHIHEYARKLHTPSPRPVAKKEPRSEEKLPPPRPDTYAVIIGIDYKDRADIPNLKFPSQDAQKVYDILTDPRYGGVPRENTTLLLNEEATRNKMIAALRKIKTWDGYIYVYFSGHGAPKAKGNNLTDAFLVPNDVIITDPEALQDTSIKLSYLQDLVDSSKAKGVMVALDACFTGGGKSIVPKGGKPLVGVLVSPELIKSQGTGRIIITSSAINQQSWEDDTELRGGIFSHYLLEGLRGKAGKDIWVTVNELAGYIKENVSRAARKLKGVEQEPQISGKADFAVTRNWERAKVMDIEIARAKIKAAFEKGHITVGQLNRALDELKTPSRSKTLEAFLEGKIDAKRFGGLY